MPLPSELKLPSVRLFLVGTFSAGVIVGGVVVGAIVSRSPKTVELVREVPVEVVREVPVENIKEVYVDRPVETKAGVDKRVGPPSASKPEAKASNPSDPPKVTSKVLDLPGAEGFKVGEVYRLQAEMRGVLVKALQVLNENEVVVTFVGVDRLEWPTHFVMKTPTKNIADGTFIPDVNFKLWKVTGTRKQGGRTVYVLEQPNDSK